MKNLLRNLAFSVRMLGKDLDVTVTIAITLALLSSAQGRGSRTDEGAAG